MINSGRDREEINRKKRIYRQRPEVKAKIKEYNSRPEVKEKKKLYFQRPEVKERIKKYNQRPERKAKKKEYSQSPKIKERLKEYRKEYNQKPEIIARKKEYSKKYYQKHKQKIKKRAKDYSKKNKEKIKNTKKKNYKRNKENILKYHKEYYKKNKKRIKARIKRNRNKPGFRERVNNYVKIKKLTDPKYDVECRLRARLNKAINRYSKKGEIMLSKDYGVNYKKIIEHLTPFPKDRENYHVDHIKPLSSFDLTNKEEVEEAFAPENHQWLLAEENMSKG